MASPVPSFDMERRLANWTTLIYGLHAFSIVTGIVGAATVIGAFLTGWPSILAVVLNYVKRSEARGTWIESHFRWQIRTFWLSPGEQLLDQLLGDWRACRADCRAAARGTAASAARRPTAPACATNRRRFGRHRW
jgi:uncharacterized membrane protein